MSQTLQTLLGKTWGKGARAGEQQWEAVLSQGKHSYMDQVWNKVSADLAQNFPKETAKPGPPTFCHIVPKSVWCWDAATLSRDPLWVSATVGESIEGLELVCGLGTGWEGREKEGRI